jgi:hypothetical protein
MTVPLPTEGFEGVLGLAGALEVERDDVERRAGAACGGAGGPPVSRSLDELLPPLLAAEATGEVVSGTSLSAGRMNKRSKIAKQTSPHIPKTIAYTLFD